MNSTMKDTQAVSEKENATGNKDAVIEMLHLKKTFGTKEVLKDINLEVRKGENLAVIGKSGSGKSVLIKCIVKLIEPDEGELKVFGKNILDLDIRQLNEIRKKIGFLFQSAALYDSMTVRENLEFPLRELPSGKKEETNSLVEEALKNVGLLDAIDKMPSELSGGMRKRVGLARTLILKPQIILYDEPTTGLDSITSNEISTLILDMQKKYSATSIIITHDMECARITCNRLVVLYDGAFIAEGTFEELKKSEDERVHSFFEPKTAS
jgi:phospholipid/cholesterol/gamma-HCH transport system ATP-binding protein